MLNAPLWVPSRLNVGAGLQYIPAMPISKKYFHDKLILLLISSNIFLAFLCVVLVFLRLGLGQDSSGYLVEYRSNLGISAFKTGSIVDIVSFVAFAILIAGTSIMLSIRTYPIRRLLALTILASGILLLALDIIVSNALMVLR